ncbi:hemoblobin-interacting domain-containing protein [Anoxynatronum buryatiense]|nr:hemoblobin-interacting domain-containing protein [Anoxynatronum buryatiense]
MNMRHKHKAFKHHHNCYLAILMALLLLVGSTVPTWALETTSEKDFPPGAVAFTIDKPGYALDGEWHLADTAPYLKDNRVMVPVRYAAQALGASVVWEADTRSVVVENGTDTLILRIGSRQLMKNGQGFMEMDTEVEIVPPGRVMVPLSRLASALGVAYNWDGTSRTAYFLPLSLDVTETIVFDAPGIYGPSEGTSTTNGNVVISSEDVVLQNQHITGTLLIAESVGVGDVTLNNITVDGDTFIEGGGTESIFINGGEYGNIIVRNTPEGGTRIVATNVEGLEIIIATTEPGELIILVGNFSRVTVEASEVTIKTQGDTRVDELLVTESGKEFLLDLSENTIVGLLSTENDSTKVEGMGTIEEKNGEATIGESVTVMKDNDKPASTSSSPTATGGGGGGGGGTGGSTTPDPPPQVTYTLALSGEGIASNPAAGSLAANTSVTVTVTPPSGKQVATFSVNGVNRKADLLAAPVNRHTFTMGANTTVAVTYENIPVGGADIPPVLSADTIGNFVKTNLDILFTDNSVWRNAVTAVKVDGGALTAGTQYELTAGKLRLNTSSIPAMQAVSSFTVTVEATGYQTAVISQPVAVGLSGSGTAADPFRVATAADLDKVRYYVAVSGLYFQQTSDIDLNNIDWQPIGVYDQTLVTEGEPFMANYNGNDYYIENMKIADNSQTYKSGSGLFSHTKEAGLSNIGLKGVDIDVPNTGSVGALVGEAIETNITNCVVENSTKVKGLHSVGGLIGYAHQSIISSSSADVRVIGETSSSTITHKVGGFIGNSGNNTITGSSAHGIVTGIKEIGGFVGYMNHGTITGCFADGNVAITGDYAQDTGGFVGLNYFATADQCYAISTVSGRTYVGGFAGRNIGTITNSYAIGSVAYTGTVAGGFVGQIQNNAAHLLGGSPSDTGYNYADVAISGSSSTIGAFLGKHDTSAPGGSGTIHHNHYNAGIAVVNQGSGANGLTLENMKKQASFPEWNFNTIWTIQEDVTTPYHRWENLSDNANLNSLSVVGQSLSPAFAANTLSYTVEVADDVGAVDIIASPSHAGASMTLNGTPMGSGTPLSVALGIPGTDTEMTLQVTAENGINTKIYTIIVSRSANLIMPPDLIADTTENYAGQTLMITFSDGQAWANAITEISVEGEVLSLQPDNIQYYLNTGDAAVDGQISLYGSKINAFLSPGSKEIRVKSTGYADAVVMQDITATFFDRAAFSTQPVGPVENGGLLATQPVVTLYDKYNNPCTDGPSSNREITLEKKTGSNWTLGGTTTVSAVNGVVSFADLTVTNPSGLAITDAQLMYEVIGSPNKYFYSESFAIPGATGLAAPTLTADTTDNYAGNNITITLSAGDWADWINAISAVKVGNDTLTPSAPGQYNIGAGILTLLTGNITQLQTPGTYTITVEASGYNNAVVSQSVTAGPQASAEFTTQPLGPSVSGGQLEQQPVLTLYDTYGNACADGPSSSASITLQRAVGDSWTLGGTSTVTAVNGVATFTDLTASNPSGAEVITDAQISYTFTGLPSFTIFSEDFTVPAFGSQSAPILTPDTTDNYAGNTIEITFVDDPAWRAAVNSIIIKTNTQVFGQEGVTLEAGKMVLDTSKILGLQEPGSHHVSIGAENYAVTDTYQTITPGLATIIEIDIQPVGPTANGGHFATPPMVKLKDAYNNECFQGPSVGAEVSVEKFGGGDWTLGGTTTRAANAGNAYFPDLTATNGTESTILNAQLSFTLEGSSASVVSDEFSIPVSEGYTLTLEVFPDSGAVGTATTSAGTSSGVFLQGFTVTVTAQPSVGYEFAGWSWGGINGPFVSAEAVLDYTMPGEDTTLWASFTQLYQLTLEASPTNGGTVTLEGGVTSNYFGGSDEVPVTAVANEGYTFHNWTREGVVVSTAASYGYQMNGQDTTLVANFLLGD